ncbi:MAG: pilus assembly protein PilM [bacterium]|nr:pilus assembly protein PilM [bacterium]
MADSLFCIDLNEKFTRISDANVSKNKIELITTGMIETTPSFFSVETEKNIENQASIISQLVSQLKIKKKSAGIIIPDGFTYSQILQMPKLKEKELLSAIRYQADEFIPMPIEETTLDLEILREDTKEKKLLILIVAVPKKLVTQIEKTVEAAGLFPEFLENELSTVGRLYSEIIPGEKKNSASLILNFGYSSSSIYLLDNNSSLVVSARTFKIGIDLFIKDIKVNLNIDDKKAQEVLKTIGFAKNSTYDLEIIVSSLYKELINEIHKFVLLTKDRFNLDVEKIILFNHDNLINLLSAKVQESLTLPVESLTFKGSLAENLVSQTLQTSISSFISVVGGNLQ